MILKKIIFIIVNYFVTFLIFTLITYIWNYLNSENRMSKFKRKYIYSIPVLRSLVIKTNKFIRDVKHIIYNYKCRRAMYFVNNYSNKRVDATKKILYYKYKFKNNACIVPICLRNGKIQSINNSYICNKHWRMTLDAFWFIVFVWRPARYYQQLKRKGYY